MSELYDVAVVGAGAAGLTAAIFAARDGARVIALDRAKKLGAKILISGGGRCNVTHYRVAADDFNGSRNAIAKVLRTFTVEETIDWFAMMGVELKREETGKMFPVTDRARTVLDALIAEAEKVEIRTGYRVETIKWSGGLQPAEINNDIRARKVILATGGRSVPKTGSDGLGFSLAKSVGHTVTETFPALVPLVIESEHWVRNLSGTSADVELILRGATGKVLHRARGSMLMTHFGVSGPVVLDMSRHWIAAGKSPLHVNFLPDVDSLEDELLDAARSNPRATVASTLRGRVPERILEMVAPATSLSKLSRDERKRVVSDLTNLQLPVTRDRGFDYAEVTAGGVPLSEVDLNTMGSRVRQGLFLCGEILDVDGRIGGFNFQWAWASGRLAGLGAAKSI